MDRRIRKGEELFAEGKPEQAEALFLDLLKDAPNDADLLNDLGVLYHALGQSRKAEEYLIKALKADPSRGETILNLSSLYQQEGRWGEAAAFLKKAAAGDIGKHEILNQLAIAQLESSDPEGAVESLGRSLALKPDQPEIRTTLLSLGDSCEMRGPGAALRVLFVQEAPCIRNYKMAKALKSRGHSVSLAYTKARLSQVYPALSDELYSECIQIRSNRDLWDVCRNYDLIHCHNEPDTLTVAALAGNVPVIHDTHDLISLRNASNPVASYLEGIANRGADGRVYVSSYQRDCAHRLYGIELRTSVVVHNYVSRHMIPEKPLCKLSSGDGEIHVVYEGGLGSRAVPHRYYLPLFQSLADQGIHVHLYPSFPNAEYEQAAQNLRFLHYHDPVSPDQIVYVLSQYDFGIIPFNITDENRRHLHSAMPNKLFEYLAAGLPVIARDLHSLREFMVNYDAGFLYSEDEEIPRILKDAPRSLRKNLRFIFEEEGLQIEDLYRAVLDRPAGRRPLARYHAGGVEGAENRSPFVRNAFRSAVQEGNSRRALEVLGRLFDKNPTQFTLRPVAGNAESIEPRRAMQLPQDPYFLDIPALAGPGGFTPIGP